MCLKLYEKNLREKTAEENIECYKILEKYKFWWFYKYKTVIQEFKIKLGKKYKSKFTFGLETYYHEHKHNVFKCRTIEQGLHSFQKFEDAKTFCKNQFKDVSKNYVIVKCYIPKNSNYYNGLFNNYDAFASAKLQYTKEILHDTTELHNKINAMFDEILNT